MLTCSTLKLAGTILAATGLSITGTAYLNTRKYKLHKRTVYLPHLSSPELSAKTQLKTLSPLRILHISDPHLRAKQAHRLRFLQQLHHARPDFIILTGDLISENQAITPLITALQELAGIPGVFVYGSNDYYAPKLKNPLRYLWKNSNQDLNTPRKPNLDTPYLTRELEKLGWINLNNTRTRLTVKDWEIELVGVNDPHLQYDRYPAPTGFSTTLPDVKIGVTHSPYTRILQKFADEHCQLTFAGHTHGGQVCLPPHQALVTNCDLPTPYCAGMFSWPLQTDQAMHGNGKFIPQPTTQMAVQISKGIGTSPYTPLRLFCPPEVILNEVLPSHI